LQCGEKELRFGSVIGRHGKYIYVSSVKPALFLQGQLFLERQARQFAVDQVLAAFLLIN
jgi:hypothetical protein